MFKQNKIIFLNTVKRLNILIMHHFKNFYESIYTYIYTCMNHIYLI